MLKPEARSERGRTSAVIVAASLGLAETGRGAATISFRVSRTHFTEVFGASPRAQSGGADELGAAARAGDVLDAEPTVPGPLADYVEAVSVEPPAVLLSGEVPR